MPRTGTRMRDAEDKLIRFLSVGPRRIHDISMYLNLSKASIYVVIDRMRTAGIISKIAKGTFKLNPSGVPDDRMVWSNAAIDDEPREPMRRTEWPADPLRGFVPGDESRYPTPTSALGRM